jgi:hypothetical protein
MWNFRSFCDIKSAGTGARRGMSDPIVTIAPNFEEWDFRDSETPFPMSWKNDDNLALWF